MASSFNGLKSIALRRLVLSNTGNKTKQSKSFSTSVPRYMQDFQHEGIPGASLPFDVQNKPKLTAMFIGYFGVALSAPFLIVRRQLLLTNAKEGDGAGETFQDTHVKVCKELAEKKDQGKDR